MDMSRGIGITERGDAGLDFSWVSKIGSHLFNILITKNLNGDFIKRVIGRDNIIVHATITGYGGSKLEPNVPTPDWSFHQLGKLIKQGFPIDRFVLRVDPIFTSEKGLRSSIEIMQRGIDIGIKRIRFSFIDTHYKHLQKRFHDSNIKLPPSTLTQAQRESLRAFITRNQSIVFESCAEGLDIDAGCISARDYTLFGLQPDSKDINGQQRRNCKCLTCKVELLNQRKRCLHQCLYCYWRD